MAGYGGQLHYHTKLAHFSLSDLKKIAANLSIVSCSRMAVRYVSAITYATIFANKYGMLVR